MIKTAALILAAGRGTRAAAASAASYGAPQPKQYAHIGDHAILTHTVRAFATNPAIALVQVVIHADDRDLYEEATHGYALLAPVSGGATRQASVLAGLEALVAHAPDRVLIHDAARPFVDAATIDRVIAALASHPGAIAALPVVDTLKRADGVGAAAETVDRAHLWAAQTPQGFAFATILSAHRAATAAGVAGLTDDAAAAQWAGHSVALVTGASANAKITTADDLAEARQRLAASPVAPGADVRTGLGFDIHAFAAGDKVWLGGVAIPHTHRLDGHSDADVVLHALTDALLGAIGDGDIGQHFPPSDAQWKGAASSLFLADAVRRVHARGGRVVCCDITVLAEAPRIGPHRPAIQATIASILGVTPRDVGIKATTMETLGAIGRREGIAAMAVATVALPDH